MKCHTLQGGYNYMFHVKIMTVVFVYAVVDTYESFPYLLFIVTN